MSVKSKNSAANVQRLQGCIDSVQDEYPSLKVQKLFLLDCREPESAGINELRNYLQQTQPPPSTSGVLYNIHWVMAQLRKAFSGQSLQLNAFSLWLKDNAQNLPTHLPSAEDMCQDLSAAGCILFLRNKQDLSQSWLVLDLQTILHNVYGTLFSPSRAVVNQFGMHTKQFCMPDEARDGRNVALIDKCFMLCSIVQRRIKLHTILISQLYCTWGWGIPCSLLGS